MRKILLALWCVAVACGALGATRPLQAATDRGPADARRMILYDASPFFFAPGGRNGFAAIQAHLPAIVALGANAILLSPVTAAPTGDFGYAVTDEFRLRTGFGPAAQLRSLIGAAHAMRLRVLLDMAANHLSDQSPYYLDAQRRGRKSPYYAWFERDSSGHPVHYFDWTNLENLSYADPAVRSYMLAAFSHWLRDYHVDGFRLDAAWPCVSATRGSGRGCTPFLRASTPTSC